MDNRLFPELNIIHLPHRQDRKESMLRELNSHNITRFRFWDGILHPQHPKTGIAQAHQRIVADAKRRQLPAVLIAEDDILFTAPGAFRYFCEQIPPVYDLYLGAISHGKISIEHTVSDFSGLLLYMVHERFYDTFLSIPTDHHLDRALRGIGLYKVCPAFVVLERPGRSDNYGKDIDNTICFIDRPLYGRDPISFE